MNYRIINHYLLFKYSWNDYPDVISLFSRHLRIIRWKIWILINIENGREREIGIERERKREIFVYAKRCGKTKNITLHFWALCSLQSNFVRLANNGISLYKHNWMHVGQNRASWEGPSTALCTKRSMSILCIDISFRIGTLQRNLKKKSKILDIRFSLGNKRR